MYTSKAIVVSKEIWACPICGKPHLLEERCRIDETVIKGQSVFYEQKYYFCPNASEDENEFETGAMVNINLLSAINAYRKQNNLPTSDVLPKFEDEFKSGS